VGRHFDDRGEKRHWRPTRSWHDGAVTRDVSSRGRSERPHQDRASVDEHAFGAALEGLVRSRDAIGEAWANAASSGNALDVTRTIDELYPRFARARGVREDRSGSMRRA